MFPSKLLPRSADCQGPRRGARRSDAPLARTCRRGSPDQFGEPLHAAVGDQSRTALLGWRRHSDHRSPRVWISIPTGSRPYPRPRAKSGLARSMGRSDTLALDICPSDLTLLHLACSGATAVKGEIVEYPDPSGGGLHRPQIDAAVGPRPRQPHRALMTKAPDSAFPQTRGRSLWWAILGLNLIANVAAILDASRQ